MAMGQVEDKTEDKRIPAAVDGHRAFVEAIDAAFGIDVDYGLDKRFIPPRPVPIKGGGGSGKRADGLRQRHARRLLDRRQ
jgi:hypothetical protein